jgi:hypothetical protein
LIALIDALSSALPLDASQVLFLRAEGLELMLLTLKEAKYAARGALRVLDAALVANGANAERFADLRGFKTLFPVLGGAPPITPRANSATMQNNSHTKRLIQMRWKKYTFSQAEQTRAKNSHKKVMVTNPRKCAQIIPTTEYSELLLKSLAAT